MNCSDLLKYTNLDTSFIRLFRNISVLLICHLALNVAAEPLDRFILDAAKRNGLVPISTIQSKTDPGLASIGEVIFTSKNLSNVGDISCQDCHLDEFSSADGLPNAVGIGGVGKGHNRLVSGGEIIPRNTLPLWGRGAKAFEAFFWDGRVARENGEILSQFGEQVPSEDLLVIAVHLPVVEIREMLLEDDFISSNKNEELSDANRVYQALVQNIFNAHPEVQSGLAEFYEIDSDKLNFQHLAQAVAEFIRSKFALKETAFHKFVFNGEELTQSQKLGAKLFYGKGKCSVCHSGPHFSDFSYHSVAFPQLGFGKNGFGIDYGRFNVTNDPVDLYKFRTPPLYNVAKTSPYGHSGSVKTLEEAVVYHFDPLRYFKPDDMDARARSGYYKILSKSMSNSLLVSHLTNEEVDAIRSFLELLTF